MPTNPIQSHEFPIFAGEIPIFLLVLSREFSGMIHFITSNNHPSNPQQPIHSLLSTSETLLTKNIELDDGKIYRKPLYLMGKTMVSG